MSYPAEVRIQLLRSKETGLIAAVSDDLPGLMTVGTEIEEIQRRLPTAIAEIISVQFGVDVDVRLEESADLSVPFESLSTALVVDLRAA